MPDFEQSRKVNGTQTVPDYSIIVPAWNESQYLSTTLVALKRAMSAQEFRGQLIVVDNNSTDGTANIAKAAGAMVVFEGVNQIARARNAGAKESGAKWLIFVDADTVISRELLSKTLILLSGGTVVGGGATVCFDRELTGFPGLLVRLWNWWSVKSLTAAGCYLFCTRKAFEEAGGFDQRQFVAEELGLSKQLKIVAKRWQQKFIVITEAPVVSSARKLDWYSSTRSLLQMIVLLLPGASRSRKMCGIWYDRSNLR